MRTLASRRPFLIVCVALVSCERLAGLGNKSFDSMTPGDPPAAGGSTAPTGGTSVGGAIPARGGNGGSTSGAPPDSTGGEGAPGGAAGVSSDHGGQGGRGCVDVEAELCMRPTWPDGVVPYRIVSDSELIAAKIGEALDVWEGKFVGSETLTFVESKIRNVRTLVMTLEKACRPTAITSDSIEVAMGGCTGLVDRVRMIGIALGLPSMHRRADRDRYLVMADPSEFSCERGEFFEPCPGHGGVPAALGAFDFWSAMFARSATPESCVADPAADALLYVARLANGTPQEACALVAQGYDPLLIDSEQGPLAELYAIAAGWTPRTVEFDSCLPPGVNAGPVIVTTEDGGMMALSLTAAGALWASERDGSSWSPWRELFPPRADAVFPVRPTAASRPGTQLVDIFVADENRIFYVSYDRHAMSTGTWKSLGAPPGDILGPFAIVPSEHGAFVYAASLTFGVHGTTWYVRHVEGPAWEPFPSSSDAPEVSSLAGTSIDGAQHLAVATREGLRYVDPGGNWHIVTTVDSSAGEESFSDMTMFTNARYTLGVLGRVGLNTWFVGCEAPTCDDPSAWSKPLIIGAAAGISAIASTLARIDVAALPVDNAQASDTCVGGTSFRYWEAPQ